MCSTTIYSYLHVLAHFTSINKNPLIYNFKEIAVKYMMAGEYITKQ